MPGPAITVLILLLVAALVATTLVIGAPYLALPILFLALVLWGGARVGTARGRRLTLDDDGGIEAPPGRPGSEAAG
jgi:hypothetical protein